MDAYQDWDTLPEDHPLRQDGRRVAGRCAVSAGNVTGATTDEWTHWQLILGFGADLLPVVPASPEVKCVPGSALDGKVGKIPSQFNREGLAHGLKDWQKRNILSNEITLWSKDRRLGICLRTGEHSAYALDVDCSNPELADAIGKRIEELVPGLPRRERNNSSKFLLLVQLPGAHKKRIITLPGVKQRIEFLGTGQQCVVAGTHPSGARYEWRGDLPQSIPTLTVEQFEALWSALRAQFGTGPAKPATAESGPSAVNTEVLMEISDEDWQSLISALRYLLPHVGDNDLWSECGYALLSLRHSRQPARPARPARQLWIDFSKKAANYEEGAPEKWWAAHESQQPRSDFRHIFTLARERGWGKTASPYDFPIVTTDAGEAPPPLPQKPIIQIVAGALEAIAEQAEALLSPVTYVTGSILVRIGNIYDLPDDDVCRAFDQPAIMHVTPERMRRLLMKAASFTRYSRQRKQWEPADCPKTLATYITEQGEWPTLRRLEAIVQAPFVRADGSVCDQPGYDAENRVLYIPNANFPPLPERISREEARAALDKLFKPFEQFPYKSDAMRAAFVAHILTEAARLAIDCSPMFWYSAPNAGTGKSLLSEMPATIVHGIDPAKRPWVQAEEMRKTLFSSLLAGDRSIAFDNLADGTKVRSAELCAFLTSSTWKDRKLGVSETVAVPNRAVVSGSGNNITPVSDLARRSLVIRIVASADTKTLRSRTFDIPMLRGYVLKHRVELLMAALSIIRAHQQSGHTGPTPLPTFEQWSRMVRDALLWLGMEDPVQTQDEETDDESGHMEMAFKLLVPTFAGSAFTALDIARLAGGIADSDGKISNALSEAGCSEPNSSKVVGYWLRACREKVGAGYQLVQTGEAHGGVKKWWFKPQQRAATDNSDLT